MQGRTRENIILLEIKFRNCDLRKIESVEEKEKGKREQFYRLEVL